MEAKQLDIGKCFNDALEIYKVNILMLLLSALIFQVISLFTLLVLSGPLFGGYCLMALNAMRKADKKIELNDMFKMLNKFWPLLGLFFLQGIAIFAGLLLLIIPGILLMTMWLYSYFIMVDQNKGVMDSLKASWNLVKEKGLWINLALAVIYVVLSGVSGQIPYIGWLINLFMVPFGVLLITSAYIQQTVAQAASAEENRPFANVPEEEGQA
jgi:hypothetical protein